MLAASFRPLAALAGADAAVEVALLAGVLAGAEELVPFDEPPQPVALSAARIAASETRLPIRRGFAVGPAYLPARGHLSQSLARRREI